MQCIPLTRHLGAEVHDVDLNREPQAEFAESLHRALLQYGVLVFPGQALQPAAHVALGRMLGPLARAHPMYPKVAGFEDIIIIRNDAQTPPENTVWHSDLSCYALPPFASVLHGVEIPVTGGDTLWCDMAAVHDHLSPAMQTFLAGLRAEHDLRQGFGFLQDGSQVERLEALRQADRDSNRALHPVVWRHPSSDRPLLYVNTSFTRRIVDLSPAESDTLLGYLVGLANRPDYQLRLRWQPGTVAIWDNWRTQHFACGDHYPAYREMQRVTVADDGRRTVQQESAA